MLTVTDLTGVSLTTFGKIAKICIVLSDLGYGLLPAVRLSFRNAYVIQLRLKTGRIVRPVFARSAAFMLWHFGPAGMRHARRR